jgi:pimeloyl-ACP methyl ester carboxylesterase
MPFMEQDAFRLYYEDSGGNKPCIVFLHGAGGNHMSWWQQVPAFRDDYRCITVDQRTLVPGSCLVRVPQAGHSTYFEQPERFNHEVGAFLQQHCPQ